MDRRSHWENVYHTKHATEVSWFEAEPATSLTLIQSVAPDSGRFIARRPAGGRRKLGRDSS